MLETKYSRMIIFLLIKRNIYIADNIGPLHNIIMFLHSNRKGRTALRFALPGEENLKWKSRSYEWKSAWVSVENDKVKWVQNTKKKGRGNFQDM